jgi:LmbE family N-acetylglucosaminyl deacetylase
MKIKTIVAIFAHPDDEAFCPGGTIAKLSQKNAVYLICVTNGDSKGNSRKAEIVLGKLRKKELEV